VVSCLRVSLSGVRAHSEEGFVCPGQVVFPWPHGFLFHDRRSRVPSGGINFLSSGAGFFAAGFGHIPKKMDLYARARWSFRGRMVFSPTIVAARVGSCAAGKKSARAVCAAGKNSAHAGLSRPGTELSGGMLVLSVGRSFRGDPRFSSTGPG